MQTYCPSCGFKNLFEGIKPKFCQSCGDGLEPKATASHKKHKPRELTYQELPDEEEPSFDIEALKRSVKLQPEEGDNGNYLKFDDAFIKQVKAGGGSFERGSSPVDDAVRQEAMGGMLNPSRSTQPQIPANIEQPRSAARRVGKLTR